MSLAWIRIADRRVRGLQPRRITGPSQLHDITATIQPGDSMLETVCRTEVRLHILSGEQQSCSIIDNIAYGAIDVNEVIISIGSLAKIRPQTGTIKVSKNTHGFRRDDDVRGYLDTQRFSQQNPIRELT
jgi:hypothetical protein